LKTITELHAEIDGRFAAAGIEIAFPQRDLHLRSGWETTRGAGSSDSAMSEMGKAKSTSVSLAQGVPLAVKVEESR